jgi:hypothetical protein
MANPDAPDLRKLFEVWVDSELKAQVIVFYQNNPGVIETVDGLARRLGCSAEVLRKEIAAHVQIGLLRERKIGELTVLVFDRDKQQSIQDFITQELHRRAKEATQ